MLYGTFDAAVRDLATAARVPIGLEKVPGPPLIFKEGFAATGAPLRLVLDALVTIDPRYEWRVLDGVVVIRPRDGLGRSREPARRPRRRVRLLDEPIGKLVRLAERALGAQTPSTDFPDNRLVWVDLAARHRARPAVRAGARPRRSGVGVRGTGAEDRKLTGLRHRMWFCHGRRQRDSGEVEGYGLRLRQA